MAKLSEQPFGLGGRLGFILGASGVMGAISAHFAVAGLIANSLVGIIPQWNSFRALSIEHLVLFVGIPTLFWLGVVLPLCAHIHFYHQYKRATPIGFLVLPATLISLATAAILIGVLLSLRNSWYPILPLIGMLVGLACAPFLLFLIRKPLSWTVICLSLGGIFSYLCWSGLFLSALLGSNQGIVSFGGYLFILAPALVVILPVPFIFRYAKDAPPLPQYASLSEYARGSARCPSCDYDLSGLPEGVLHCPECAHPRHTDSVESVRRLLATTQRTPAEIAAFLASGTNKSPDPAPERTPD